MILHTCIMICTQITIFPTTSRSFQESQRIVLPGRHAFTVENIFAILKRTVHEVLKVKWYHSLRPAEAILRAQRRTDIERKVKWRDIVDPVYATGYQQKMLNARSIIIKEMNSLVIVRLLLIGPCLHKSRQGAVQCSSPYHYRSGSIIRYPHPVHRRVHFQDLYNY